MTLGIRPQFDGLTADAIPLDAGAIDDPGSPDGPARVFYRVDSRRITLREFWWGSRSSIVTLALFKLFRARVQTVMDDPSVETLAPFEVQASGMPGVIMQRLNTGTYQLKALGFHSPIWHVIEDDVNKVTTYLATLTHESGRVWARVHNRVWHVRTPAVSTVFCELVSELGDGRWLWSLTSKPDLLAPPSCTVVRDVDASPSQLLADHQVALGELGAVHVQLVPDQDALRASVERLHADVREFHLARGVLTRLTQDERQTAVAFRSSMKSAEDTGSQYPAILAEVERLQNKKSSRSNTIILLLVSAALFIGAGMTNMGGNGFSPKILAIIVAVLFVHEMGHWVAMRMFGYRNLKMFFIPFLGAAVSGQHYNVAGWKKVVVSLMGPLPGLVIGAGIGWLGVTLDQPQLITISLTALALNGFNLLPILPLDGGWVVQAILFSRHHLLELAFRIAALAALAILAIVLSDKVLTAVAIMMAVSLPAMYKLARITNELRKAHVPPGSDDGQTLPNATANAIIGRIKATFGAKLSNTVAAQYTLHIFENLNARPPGVLASVGFGILHFGSLGGAAAVAALIYVGMLAGDVRSVDASSLTLVRTPGDSVLATPRNVIVATFNTPDKLLAAVGDLQREGSRNVGVQRFGQALVIALPVENVIGLRTMQASLEQRGATVFVSMPDEPVQMQLSCTATSAPAGQALERELGGYFAGRALNLLPPWHPGISWSPDERARYGKARETHRSMARALTDVGNQPAIMALLSRLDSAYESEDTVHLARLEAERVVMFAEFRRSQLGAMRKDVTLDTAVVSAYSVVQDEADTTSANRARRTALMGPLLGQLPLVGGEPAPGTAEWSASGMMNADGTSINLPVVRYQNAFQGPPVLVRWLLANGCADIKYQFIAKGKPPRQ